MPQFYPNNYNFGGYYPNINQPNLATPQYPSQSFSASAPQPSMLNTPAMTWVDGEGAARSFQIPASHPIGQLYPLWDTNENVIYFKALDQFGRPVPLRKASYKFDDEPQQVSGALPPAVDTSQFVTKNDMDEFKNEIRDMFSQIRSQPQNPARSNQNRNEQGGK